MKLYLVRHGEALPAQMDPQRPLSAQGQARVYKLAERMAERQVTVTHIFHSGILRARQTAEIIAHSLHIDVIEQIMGLQPEDPVDQIIRELADLDENIMLVGHLPFMANLLWGLCSDGWSVQFETATAVCLERTEPGHWRIDVVLGPEEFPLT